MTTNITRGWKRLLPSPWTIWGKRFMRGSKLRRSRTGMRYSGHQACA